MTGLSDTGLKIALFAALIPSVILHEIAHGWVARLFGDDTAERAGRLTLNPLPHIDPFGSVLLPAMLAVSSFGVFGYAKPVPVNPRKMRSPRNHSLLVSLAGPATNLTIALVAVVVHGMFEAGTVAQDVVLAVGFVNVLLAVFNMIPIPPLDGSALIERVLPARAWPAWLKFRRYSMGLLLIVVLMVPAALGRIFDPALDWWLGLL